MCVCERERERERERCVTCRQSTHPSARRNAWRAAFPRSTRATVRAASCVSDRALFVEEPPAALPPSERERFEESDDEAPDESVDADNEAEDDDRSVGAEDAVSERPSSSPRW